MYSSFCRGKSSVSGDGSPSYLAQPHIWRVTGRVTLTCLFALETTYHLLNQPNLYCLKPIEGTNKWPNQLCTYQYTETPLSLSKMKIVALLFKKSHLCGSSTLFLGNFQFIHSHDEHSTMSWTTCSNYFFQVNTRGHMQNSLSVEGWK